MGARSQDARTPCTSPHPREVACRRCVRAGPDGKLDFIKKGVKRTRSAQAIERTRAKFKVMRVFVRKGGGGQLGFRLGSRICGLRVATFSSQPADATIVGLLGIELTRLRGAGQAEHTATEAKSSAPHSRGMSQQNVFMHIRYDLG